MNEVQKINKNAQKIAKDNSEINIDIEGYKTHLFEKVNRLLKKIKQIKSYQKEINYYINNKEKCKEKINKAIQDVKNISNEYENQKTGEINEENSNNNNKSNIGDLKDIFTRMNNIEKNTQKICNIGKTIEEWEDINSRLEIALKTVENKIYSIITEAMNYGSGNPRDKKDNNNGNNINNDNNNINNNKDSNNYENSQQNKDENNEKKEEEFETKNEENKQDNQNQIERDEGQGEGEEEGKVTDNIHNAMSIDNKNPKEETVENNKGDVKEIKIKGLNKNEEKQPIKQNGENGENEGDEEYEDYEEAEVEQ